MLVEFSVLSITLYLLFEFLIIPHIIRPYEIVKESNGPLASQIATFFQQLFNLSTPIQLQLFTFLKLHNFLSNPSFYKEYQMNFVQLCLEHSKKLLLEKDKERHFEETPLHSLLPIKITWLILLCKHFPLQQLFTKEWKELCAIWAHYLRMIQFSKTLASDLLITQLFVSQKQTTIVEPKNILFYLNIHSHYSKFLQPLLDVSSVHFTSTEIEQLSQVTETNPNGTMVKNEFAKYLSKQFSTNSVIVIFGGTNTLFHICHGLLCANFGQLNCAFLYCGQHCDKQYTFVKYLQTIHPFFREVVYPSIVNGYFLQMKSEVSLNWFTLQKELLSLNQFTLLRILKCQMNNQIFGFGQFAQLTGTTKVKLSFDTQSKKSQQQITLPANQFVISKFSFLKEIQEEEELIHELLVQRKEELPSKGFYLHLLSINQSHWITSCKIEITMDTRRNSTSNSSSNAMQFILDDEIVTTIVSSTVILIEASESLLKLYH